LSQPTIAFIGTGNMARAILEGLLSNGYPAKSIWATRRQVNRLDDLKNQGVNTTDDNAQAVSAADIVVMSVKPQMMRETLAGLEKQIQQGKPLVISVAAGIDVAALERWAGGDVAVIRAMPNTPSLLKRGACGLFANSKVSQSQHDSANQIMSAVGITLWCDTEAGIDQVIAVSGSGPAYFFLMMEKMIDAGIEMGLDADSARALTLQTALGAAEMTQQTGIEPAELRRRVTSPGGTTEQAIMSFERDALGDTVSRAMNACRDRAVEMTQLLCKD